MYNTDNIIINITVPFEHILTVLNKIMCIFHVVYLYIGVNLLLLN